MAQTKSLWAWIKPQRTILGAGLLAIAVAAGMVLSISRLVPHIVDKGLGANNAAQFNQLIWQLLGLVVVLAACSGARVWWLNLASERVVQHVRQSLFAHLLKLSAAWHNQYPAHDLQSRFANDLNMVQSLLNNALPLALRNILLVLGGGVLMAQSSGYLSLLLLCLLPLVVLPLVLLGPRLRQKSGAMQHTQSRAANTVFENLQAVREVQVLGAVQQQTQFLSTQLGQSFAASMGYVRTRAVVATTMIFVVFAMLVVLLRLGGAQVIAGQLSAGQLTGFVVNALLVATSLGALSDIYADMQRASGAAQRLQDLFATPIAPQGTQNLPAKLDIAFNGVSFAYPDQPLQNVLHDVCLAIPQGHMVAFVGPSGGGKSSLCQLLLGLFAPTQGDILVGDQNLQTIAPAGWHSVLGYVPQKPQALSLSVRDYICLGLDNVPPHTLAQAIEQAIEMAQLADVVASLPQGLDTVLGAGAQNLSGGQWQRLAIARALVRQPKILLLDEATAHLDTANEQALQQALKNLRQGGQTLLVIAHRLSTVVDADTIVVLDAGHVAGMGTHAQLLQDCPTYQKLFGI